MTGSYSPVTSQVYKWGRLCADFLTPTSPRQDFPRGCPAPAFPGPGERRGTGRSISLFEKLHGEQIDSQPRAPGESGRLIRLSRNEAAGSACATAQKCQGAAPWTAPRHPSPSVRHWNSWRKQDRVRQGQPHYYVHLHISPSPTHAETQHTHTHRSQHP